MTWDPYNVTFLGQEVRDQRRGEGPVPPLVPGRSPVRDHRGERPPWVSPRDQPVMPRVPPPVQPVTPRVPPRDPRPRPVEDTRPIDPRVTTPHFPTQPAPPPDPRVTTYPEDVRPRERDRDRDDDDRRRPRRRPRDEHRDYVFVPGYEYWPRWYPYWDPYWYWLWRYLFWYYRGHENPDYAEWARDQVLRTSYAPRYGWL